MLDMKSKGKQCLAGIPATVIRMFFPHTHQLSHRMAARRFMVQANGISRNQLECLLPPPTSSYMETIKTQQAKKWPGSPHTHTQDIFENKTRNRLFSQPASDVESFTFSHVV